jgi:hypothetical protein
VAAACNPYQQNSYGTQGHTLPVPETISKMESTPRVLLIRYRLITGIYYIYYSHDMEMLTLKHLQLQKSDLDEDSLKLWFENLRMDEMRKDDDVHASEKNFFRFF